MSVDHLFKIVYFCLSQIVPLIFSTSAEGTIQSFYVSMFYLGEQNHEQFLVVKEMKMQVRHHG